MVWCRCRHGCFRFHRPRQLIGKVCQCQPDRLVGRRQRPKLATTTPQQESVLRRQPCSSSPFVHKCESLPYLLCPGLQHHGAVCVRGHQRQELLLTESSRTYEISFRTATDNLCDPADMVVMPMRDHNHSHRASDVDTYLVQVAEGCRVTVVIHAGIHDNPFAVTIMDDSALSVAGAEERQLEIVPVRRCYLQRIVCACSCATWPAVASSESVHTGRRRNLRIAVRLRCPPSLVAYPTCSRNTAPTLTSCLSSSLTSSRLTSASSSGMSLIRSMSRTANEFSATAVTTPSHAWRMRNEVRGSCNRTAGAIYGMGGASKPDCESLSVDRSPVALSSSSTEGGEPTTWNGRWATFPS